MRYNRECQKLTNDKFDSLVSCQVCPTSGSACKYDVRSVGLLSGVQLV